MLFACLLCGAFLQPTDTNHFIPDHQFKTLIFFLALFVLRVHYTEIFYFDPDNFAKRQFKGK